MVIIGSEPYSGVVGGYAVGEDVVGSLYVEGFFNLGVWRDDVV